MFLKIAKLIQVSLLPQFSKILENSIATKNRNRENKWGIFLDLKRAFESVNCKHLQKKTQRYRVRGMALPWFGNYLENRYPYEQINNDFNSRLQKVTYGVLQGSVLGSVLIILLSKIKYLIWGNRSPISDSKLMIN